MSSFEEIIDNTTDVENGIVIVWTSDNKDTAIKTALDYASNSINKGWWGHVTLAIWGPSVKLLADDKQIQKTIVKLAVNGVMILVSHSSAESYGVTSAMNRLKLETGEIGELVTDYIKNGWRIVTF